MNFLYLYSLYSNFIIIINIYINIFLTNFLFILMYLFTENKKERRRKLN